MAGKKLNRSDVDRFSGDAITTVTITPEQKKAIAAINASQKRTPKAARPTGKKK